jgi:hypothetical protein
MCGAHIQADRLGVHSLIGKAATALHRSPAFVFDTMEPERPKADRVVLRISIRRILSFAPMAFAGSIRKWRGWWWTTRIAGDVTRLTACPSQQLYKIQVVRALPDTRRTSILVLERIGVRRRDDSLPIAHIRPLTPSTDPVTSQSVAKSWSKVPSF